MAKKFTELTTASQINETDITAISQETGGVWGSFKATISAIAQKIITGINFANAFNTSDKTVAGAVNEKLTSTAVAYVEVSPAESAHSVGEYIIYNGILYKVTSAIAIGDSLAVGTNIAVETLNERIDNKTSKTGDTMTGNLVIAQENPTTSKVYSHLDLGNNIPEGTTGNVQGYVRIFSNTDKRVDLVADNITSNRDISLPNNNGTLGLQDQITILASSTGSKTYAQHIATLTEVWATLSNAQKMKCMIRRRDQYTYVPTDIVNGTFTMSMIDSQKVYIEMIKMSNSTFEYITGTSHTDLSNTTVNQSFYLYLPL